MHSIQLKRQLNTPAYEGRYSLDFAPFTAELERLDVGRLAELERWLPQAGVPEIAGRLQNGELTSRLLALFFLQRIRTHAGLNAFLELNPDALEIADQLDAEMAAGRQRSKLHGIPVLVKDNIATGDRMHTAAGAKAMENARAPRDAFIIQKLRAAGMLVLGKANLSEWANFMTSTSANGFSVLGGQTRNPYGHHDVSGSSSGSAAAVAAGLIPLAVGTETCGSLIAPASANSIVSLKPSLGLVSRDLIIPITSLTDTAGPMARSVTDLVLLMQALVGPDPNDPITLEAEAVCGVDCTRFLDAGGLQGMQVGFVSTHKPSAAVTPLLEVAKAALRRAGAEVVDLRVRGVYPWDDFKELLCYGMKHDLNAYLAAVKGYAPVASLEEIIAFNQQDLPNHAPFGQDLLERSQASSLTIDQHAALAERMRSFATGELGRLREESGSDLLVSRANHLAGYYAMAGFPALTVPAGYRRHGAPFGLTFVGEHLEDGKLIAAAYAFEQVMQARIPPKI